VFQLDELGFAIRSPIGRADEHEKEALGSAEGCKGLELPVLVHDFERRDGGTHGGARLHVLVDIENIVKAILGLGAKTAAKQDTQQQFAYQNPSYSKRGQTDLISTGFLP
jgi:hypothetical protein